MSYTVQTISQILKPLSASIATPDSLVTTLLTDSRTLTKPDATLFFAIPTKRNSGSRYVESLYNKGVRNFVLPVTAGEDFVKRICALDGANVLVVNDVVDSLQALAQYHRGTFHNQVVGITGSNGKTMVKDWIVQLISGNRSVVASPKSYNSQIGVPLSVWQMEKSHDIAIIEAGISQPNEMSKLRAVIKPTIGIPRREFHQRKTKNSRKTAALHTQRCAYLLQRP